MASRCRELHLANCTGLDDDVLVRLTSSMRRMRLDDEDAQMLGGMSLEEAQHGGAHGAGWDGGSPGDGALAGYPVQHPEPGRANTARSFIEVGVLTAYPTKLHDRLQRRASHVQHCG